MADYNLQLVHRPGKLNPLADALSRRVQDELDIGDRLVNRTCLLPQTMFAAIAVEKANDRYNTVERLVKEAYESDNYYQDVLAWLGSYGDEDRPKYPPNSGKIRRQFSDNKESDFTDAGFPLDKDLLLFEDRLYIPENVRLMVLSTAHDSPLSGHFGIRKTLELIQRDYWWPELTKMVEEYVKSCETCQRTKPTRRKYGLLQPLPVATDRWTSVTIDFMTDLPTCEKYDAIMVVVDRFTKLAHFSPCTNTITAEQTAKLYIDRIFRHHGVPTEIISDRGRQFDAKFARTFWESLGVNQKLSTAFHPETDGQTERVNSVINQYLRAYTSYQPDNWVPLLPLAEFAYNNTVHTATGVAPFFANYGLHPNNGTGMTKGVSDKPNKLASHMEEISEFLCANLEVARTDMKRFADQHRSESPTYKVGDKVMLSTRNFRRKRPKTKWADKWIGPLKVVSAHKDGMSYRLALPNSLDKIHPVFHTSLLKPFINNHIPDRVQSVPLPPDIVDGYEEYEVQEILDHKVVRKRDKYLVWFKGYGPDQDEWLSSENLANSKKLLKNFHRKFGDKSEVGTAPKRSRKE